MQVPEYVSGRRVTPRGVHGAPIGFQPWMDPSWPYNAEHWQQLLTNMGVSWMVLLSEGDAALLSGAAEALLEAGVIPIVRFNYQFPRHWTHGDVTGQYVSLYSQYGAPFIAAIGNEPFDPREWVDGDVPPKEEAWAIIADRWNEAACITAERGGIAGFPDGPSYNLDDNPFYRIGDPDLHWQEGRAVYLGHHYGKGRPWDYPRDDVSRFGVSLTEDEYCQLLDIFCGDPSWQDLPLDLINAQRLAWANPDLTAVQDDVCWHGWKRVQHFSQEAFGFQVQMAMTEGGWVPRDRAGSGDKNEEELKRLIHDYWTKGFTREAAHRAAILSIDIRWPLTTPTQVAVKSLQMYGDDHPFFAVCPWLLACSDMGGSGWEYDAWHGWAFEPEHGRQKPVIQALIDNPPNGNDLLAELYAAMEACLETDARLAAAIALAQGVQRCP